MFSGWWLSPLKNIWVSHLGWLATNGKMKNWCSKPPVLHLLILSFGHLVPRPGPPAVLGIGPPGAILQGTEHKSFPSPGYSEITQHFCCPSPKIWKTRRFALPLECELGTLSDILGWGELKLQSPVCKSGVSHLHFLWSTSFNAFDMFDSVLMFFLWMSVAKKGMFENGSYPQIPQIAIKLS